MEVRRAQGSDSADFAEAQYPTLVEIGKARGYAFMKEDIHFARAAGRKPDDNEPVKVTGGGIGDDCSNDYLCKDALIMTHYSPVGYEYHGKGECAADYACQNSWNTCGISRQSFRLTLCDGSAY